MNNTMQYAGTIASEQNEPEVWVEGKEAKQWTQLQYFTWTNNFCPINTIHLASGMTPKSCRVEAWL